MKPNKKEIVVYICGLSCVRIAVLDVCRMPLDFHFQGLDFVLILTYFQI